MISRLKAFIAAHKKSVIISTAVVVVLGSLAAVYFVLKVQKGVERTSNNTAAQEVKTDPRIASPLTGVLVMPDLAARPVTAVMIENSPDARPQSGLKDAGVVFEAIAEGGITRFVALYQEAKPKYIGPVRSLRPYYTDWVKTFDASIAHVGGSAQALREVRGDSTIADLDQFFNAGAYERVNFRYAPHNVYTDTKRLDALNKAKGHTESSFKAWPRKADSVADNQRARRIRLHISGPLFDVQYKYNSKNNTYSRYVGGSLHKDREGNKTLTPKVVIAMEAPHHLHSDGEHNVYDLVGSGRAFIFQDGTVVKGRWTKSSRSSQVKFTNAKGNEVKLNAGQVWISAVDPGGNVSFSK